MKLSWHSEKRKLSELIPSEYNPRKATEKQAKDLSKSLEKFDLADPIIINTDNHVVGGHFRLRILKDKGEDIEVDVRVPNRKLTDKEERELNIRLNKNTGQFDYELLANFNEELLLDTGFESVELDKIFQLDTDKTEYDFDADAEAEKIKKCTVKKGDLYQLGDHRLMCADATSKEDVERLMVGEKADMVFTDPPYGVSYGVDNNKIKKEKGDRAFHWSKTRKNSQIQNDNKSAKELSESLWRPAFKNMYEYAQDHCSFYMTMCQGGDQMMMMMMMSEHWNIKHELIWLKSSPVFSMGRLDYDYQHEPILYGWKKTHKFYGGGQFKKSIWEIAKPSKSELHPTMKPIALIENALLNSSKRGDIVLDLFGGSGSTLIACEQTNRKCMMMEIDPLYCQVIITRWETLTGKKEVKL